MGKMLYSATMSLDGFIAGGRARICPRSHSSCTAVQPGTYG
jgi:hypothetical protein